MEKSGRPGLQPELAPRSHTHPAGALTKRVFRDGVQPTATPVSPVPHRIRPIWTHPKYRNGHILKCFTSRASSFSASWRSFRGRPRPLAAGAFVLTTFGCEGASCRRPSWLSTSSSCRREHGAHVHPYPRLGFASSGGFTQLIWKNFLHRSHCTVSRLRRRQHVIIDGGRGSSTYGGHHLVQVSHVRRVSVRSGTTSFSATTYS